MQLSLLDLSGKETSQTLEIQWLSIEQLEPHPDNPRLVYRDDIINAIASGIEKDGFQPCYALLVRPFEGKYQILSGHTRLKAAQKVGCKSLPCWVKDMSDDDAFFELVKANNQGELYPLEIGIHALKYVELSEGGRGKKGGLSEYAREIGKAKDTVSGLKLAAQVYSKLSDQSDSLLEKSTHLSHISKTPEAYWQQLTELLLVKEWSVKETEEVCKAVRDVDIPEHFTNWLNPEKWIKTTISEVVNGGEIRTPRDLKLWIETAQSEFDNLSDSRKVVIIQDDKEIIEYWDMKSMFLDELPSLCRGDKKPSKKQIQAIAKSILDDAEKHDREYEKWKKLQEGEEARKKALEEENRKRLALEQAYAPIGLNKSILDVSLEEIGFNFDAVITDIPYLLSNDGTTVRSGKEVSVNKNFADNLEEAPHPKEYVKLFFDVLREGGYFVTTVTSHIGFELWQECIKCGFELRQKLIWFKRNAPPSVVTDRFKSDYEDIYVFIKPGATPYFGYNDVKIDDSQRGATIDIPQCSGKERLNWHDTQKPLELYELLIKAYCPTDGKIFEPFAGSATTVVAAKRLQRKCTWVEQKESFYQEAERRIEDSPYFWETK